jgi:cellulose synthase/poly-beta-1,6-N-acetylglucosamine synthase-like glycosyltransferase
MVREMALTLKIIFWLCVGMVTYNYVGYPILLFLLGVFSQVKSDFTFLLKRKSRRPITTISHQSQIAILVSAFNEEAVIETRIQNLCAVDYPEDFVEILIGLDAPTDSTSQILSQLASPRVRVFNFPIRRGKLAVISDLAQCTSARILIFSDANTSFRPDCVRNLVRHFDDPKVGAVSGEEIRVINPGTDPAGESLYWRYESALKILESRIHCLHSANGGVYAIRRELFRPQPNLIVEDFQIPLDVRFQGYRVVYDPDAVAVEEIAPTFTSQFERRIRLAAGNFQTLFGHPEYLNPFKGGPAFAYWSHRVLRWLTPCLLIVAFACSAGLVSDLTYRCLFFAQCAFYVIALLGYGAKKKGRSPGFFGLPLYFCSMNTAYLFGLARYLSGHQSVAWAATPRRAAVKAAPSNLTDR